MMDTVIPALVGLGAFALARRASAAQAQTAVPKAPPIFLNQNGAVVVGDIGFYPSQHPELDPETAARYLKAYKKTQAVREQFVKVLIPEGNAHVRERANDDHGVRVEEYQRAGGLRAGMAWCAAFEAWGLKQVYGKRPSWTTGSTSGNNWAVRRALQSGALSPDYVLTGNDLRANPVLFAKVQPGWLWINGSSANGDPLTSPPGTWSKGHTGIVISPYGKGPGNFTTIEGNTWRANQGPAGQGVYFQDDKIKLKANNVIFFDPIALTEALKTTSA
jgi:hypothetical protein